MAIAYDDERCEATKMNDDFNENNASFYLLSLVHCKYAAMLSALIGILCVVALFAVSVVHFEWYLYETVIDAVTLGGFGLFLLSGVAVHYAVLYAIQTTKVHSFILLHVNSFIGQLIWLITH